MKLIGGTIFIIGSIILAKNLKKSGIPPLLLVIFIPAITAYLMFSITFFIFSFGILLMICMGSPITNRDTVNTPYISRRYGILFDIAGLVLIVVALFKWI